MKIHKGDKVIVRSGKYRGQRSEVVEAFPKDGTVIVAGVNVAKRHQKQRGQTMQAGIIDKALPMPASAVSLWCDKHNGPARAGTKIDGTTKTRICRQCGADL